MNPHVTTKPETVTYNMVQRFLPEFRSVIHLARTLADEYDENQIAADFAQAEEDGNADEGADVVYGGFDSRDVRRWAELAYMFEQFLDAPVTVTFADDTTEVTTVRGLALRDYFPVQAPPPPVA